MRLRVVAGQRGEGVALWDAPRDRWLPLRDALAHRAAADAGVRALLSDVQDDMIAFLAGGTAVREAALRLAERLADEAFAADLTPRLPFAARSLRPFLLSPRHSEGVARGMAARYAPSEVLRQAEEHERATGETFPGFRPRPLMLSLPLLYQGNHNALVPSGTPIAVPPYGHDIDFELELGFVVCRDVRDADPEECREAIGGLVILNDVSLRDTQWEEIHGSPLGPVQKCKSFTTAMSSEVLTADEVLDDLASLTGDVDVDGERWASGRADDFAHPLEVCLARACAGETVVAGELFSTGTLAGCSGIELGRLPQPGATVALTVPRIGTLANRFGGVSA
ncbi:fumarylacetoacetate hydrolase family protein [Amycolatopsis pithecellobii]|uniref:Fumarylacetoacetate hydrolase family protein n=1 Tax=Amycolatopsis pithecellobii TaxID=664692 RepID=A0A6N7Z9V8_9PSEU|nr:fumarylacetoacetate hydrolase family protein [Amycolatopsis pithecellobii]MTD58517.1 fumarylacetoacetate hydrolase family protein [Amycolatopsis pithecellobii]